MPRYDCRLCGGSHPLPEALSAGLPEPVIDLPFAERQRRVVLGDEICKIDEARFFLRGNVELYLEGAAVPFVWTVWVELSRKPFKRALALWMRDARTREPPYPGTLATALPLYDPPTKGLAVEVQSRPVGTRFSVGVLGDHPLAREQRGGVSPERAQAWAEALAHA